MIHVNEYLRDRSDYQMMAIENAIDDSIRRHGASDGTIRVPLDHRWSRVVVDRVIVLYRQFGWSAMVRGDAICLEPL